MINLLQIYKVSLMALRRNPMRTVLTMLGVIIGVGCVVAMVAIGQGASAAIRSQIGALGTNMLIIFSGSRSSGGVRHGMGSVQTLTVDDAARSPECRRWRSPSPVGPRRSWSTATRTGRPASRAPALTS
jgi:putative ABC transport system permease protein